MSVYIRTFKTNIPGNVPETNQIDEKLSTFPNAFEDVNMCKNYTNNN